ncbi:ATP-binding cassette domain-containing protein [Patescibacteria group bacterium]|nr:ATP-binding cassette domain-containing protein [Patescibacteria group bacterium]MBU1868268.1 ATP-binding cassette domain-containing protein [Patescibacteria group bacterium]
MNALVKVENLTKTFGKITALKGINFQAHKGEIFGLLGPNGAGKTTAIRVIATVLTPTTGSAVVAGFDICNQPVEVRKNIGVLTTETGVYERFTGRENLKYFGELFNIPRDQLTNRLNELIELFKMNEFIDRRAGEYSTGMKQKLAIARSIIHDPQIIIFDEPTAGLDVLASQTVLNFMRQARELGKCVILSTHRLSDAERLCDRAAIIHQGKIVGVDEISRLMEISGTNNLEDAFLQLIKNRPLDEET